MTLNTREGFRVVATVAAVCIFAWLSAPDLAAASPEEEARQILADAGVKGGLVVHLGCGDGRLTAALRDGDSFLVHGLDSDAADVQEAKKHIGSLGLYGPVSVERFEGSRLPYADNLARLVVAEDLGKVSMKEVMRVLAPGGVACVRLSGQWTKTVKPRPAEIDEWTHFLYDATGNAVSNDSVVGPPRHLQWDAGPKYARGHENLGSVSVAVSSAGRIFYIADEGPNASVALPSDWQLVARDAFSGVLLWKKPIAKWEWRLRPFRSGPPQVHRRLVAIGETVYATLGYGEPLVALDAATGEILKTYPGTKGTEEIVCDGDTLYLVVGDPGDQEALDAAVRRGEPLPPVQRRVMAVDARSGKSLWQTPDRALPEILPLTLAASGGRAFYQTTEEIIAVDATTGKELWRANRPADFHRRAWATTTLVVYGDVVISADQSLRADESSEPQPVAWEVTMAGGGKPGEMAAFSAATGEQLWKAPCQQTYNAPPDLLIADDLLWTGLLIKAGEPGITQAVDPVTGEVVRQRPADQDFYNPGMGHHRCYRNKATCRYLVMGRSGIEFVDLASGKAEPNHWVRGTCQHGVVPCNGLVYSPPHTCGCFIKAKLNGFNALAPAEVSDGMDVSGPRRERGPAYGKVDPGRALPGDWPTYRHDAGRSGFTTTALPAKLEPSWQTKLGGRLSPIVVAEGRAYVADVDAHTVHALDADSGERLWSFVAGGRVDSPPTISQGSALFGSADGWVYCVRCSDGQLVWRTRAAPGVRRVVSYDRLESSWPVSGSVLVLDGVVYCAAGRSSYLDGGIRLCRIDAATGELLSETCLSGYDENGDTVEAAARPRGTEMPGALPDVLSSDGRFVFMRHHTFDREGVEQPGETPHLFSSVGFLDDRWWHRTYWIYGTDFKAGWGGWWQVGNRVPAGRILAMTGDEILGFGRSFIPHGNSGQWQIGETYRFFASPKEFEMPKPPADETARGKRRGNQSVTGRSIVPCRWSKEADLEARALVLAGETLFAAGPLGDTAHSLAAFEGREGVRLRAIATADGSTLAEWELDALPVFDGLAAAAGRLYLVTADGSVRCFRGQR